MRKRNLKETSFFATNIQLTSTHRNKTTLKKKDLVMVKDKNKNILVESDNCLHSFQPVKPPENSPTWHNIANVLFVQHACPFNHTQNYKCRIKSVMICFESFPLPWRVKPFRNFDVAGRSIGGQKTKGTVTHGEGNAQTYKETMPCTEQMHINMVEMSGLGCCNTAGVKLFNSLDRLLCHTRAWFKCS